MQDSYCSLDVSPQSIFKLSTYVLIILTLLVVRLEFHQLIELRSVLSDDYIPLF